MRQKGQSKEEINILWSSSSSGEINAKVKETFASDEKFFSQVSSLGDRVNSVSPATPHTQSVILNQSFILDPQALCTEGKRYIKCEQPAQVICRAALSSRVPADLLALNRSAFLQHGLICRLVAPRPKAMHLCSQAYSQQSAVNFSTAAFSGRGLVSCS